MPKLLTAVVSRPLFALGSAAGALLQPQTVAAAPPAVERPPPERFGEAGQLVLPNLLGYAVPLGPEVTLWPRLGVGGALGLDEESLDHEVLQLTAELPVLFHLGRYVFASGGLGATATLGRGESESATRRNGAIAVSGTTALGVVLGR